MVNLNYSSFSSSPTGLGEKIELIVTKIEGIDQLENHSTFASVLTALDLDFERLQGDRNNWTMVILENLKDKSNNIKAGRLKYTLSIAMPLAASFKVFLNGIEVVSSKESIERSVEFTVAELSDTRLKNLNVKYLEENWMVVENKIISNTFKEGVSGEIYVTRQTLVGKSDDLQRSHGFFVKIRNRLINEGDALFGIDPPQYGTFNYFRAEILADDLDEIVTASREGVETSIIYDLFKSLLQEIYLEARSRREELEKEIIRRDKSKPEEKRNIIASELLEKPIADALSISKQDQTGSEADDSWFYLTIPREEEINSIIDELYTTDRKKYSYAYSAMGRVNRMVKLNPKTRQFTLNQDHEFVRAYSGEAMSEQLLQDFATTEALLEIYLKESHIDHQVIGDILEKRDLLLRSLALDHPYSPAVIASSLKDAKSDERNLEMYLVSAARALGFVATQISGSGEPDGLARFKDYSKGEIKITLEAKSSIDVPSLSAIDFAGLDEHVKRHNAQGCLLLAPSYPGTTVPQDDSAAAFRARQYKISCWTIDQLAALLELSSNTHINAKQVLDIVTTKFSPTEVSESLDEIFSYKYKDKTKLYNMIISSLRTLEGKIKDQPRNVSMIVTAVMINQNNEDFESLEVEMALLELIASSQGGMSESDGRVYINVSIDELKRRVSGLTKKLGNSMRNSNFKDN